MTERAATCPRLIKASNVLNFIPGAEGFRDCITYHGPIRARVACRVSGVFSMVQRLQGASGLSVMVPQNGQTCFAAIPRFARTAGGSGGVELLLAIRDMIDQNTARRISRRQTGSTQEITDAIASVRLGKH